MQSRRDATFSPLNARTRGIGNQVGRLSERSLPLNKVGRHLAGGLFRAQSSSSSATKGLTQMMPETPPPCCGHGLRSCRRRSWQSRRSDRLSLEIGPTVPSRRRRSQD